ncbi:thermonuclease family protein [Bergeriella denitrificans]|uniref:Nuclease n=1 Tax=Bergeriella denitrificans TaxID=494 RepID=A0A378UGK6_BERDE|nr:thermonuclease family protein [Bergeriella denitrificans]STZ76447.1 nuclease [Bergeriella denitrificans]
MYKWLAVVTALAAALGYSNDKIQWLKLGGEVIERVSSGKSGAWQGVLTDLMSAAGIGQQEAASERRNAAKQSTYSGRVTRVSDGDTLQVTDQHGRKHKIRMAYIDAPELQQSYGARSRDNLKAAADGAKVKVRVFDIDRYNREVAQVSKGATDLNLMQIRDGAAWHYTSYAKKQQSKTAYADYAAAQTQAQKARAGLWRGKNPQAPWDYRREKNGNTGSQNSDGSKPWFGLW